MNKILKKINDASALFVVTVCLLAIGNIMVFSASSMSSYKLYGDLFYYVKKNVIYSTLGFMLMFFFIKFNYRLLRKFAYPVLIAAIALTVAVLVPGIGVVINGARRWIDVGPITFQPTEFAKLSLILFGATLLSRSKETATLISKPNMRLAGVAGVVALLTLRQPDMGTAMILLSVVFTLFFLSGVRLRQIFIALLAGMFGAALFAVTEEYRRQRLIAFVNPWNDPQGSGFQIIQSLTAFGSGGIFGLGIGKSMQKFSYLPQAHTDFIFAILGEEFGLLGTLGTLILFALFSYFGLRIAYKATDRFGKLLAGTLTSTILIQATINIMATVSMIPVTGVPLPFISFGGTSLIVNMAAVGILLNIANSQKLEVVFENNDLRRRNSRAHIPGNRLGRDA